MRGYVVGGLVLSIAMNTLLVTWFMGVSPLSRQIAAYQLDLRKHAARPVVILGDSILAAVDSPEGVVNLAMNGATIDSTLDEVLPRIGSLEPRRVLVGLGINDLRYGALPEEAAQKLLTLANAITEEDPSTEVIILAVLPLARTTPLAAQTNNKEIVELNLRLSEAVARRHKYIDHTRLFIVGGALDDSLTYDGLHLNGLGEGILARLLFHGLALDAR
jgi:lysophospholipase L1-like esterase